MKVVCEVECDVYVDNKLYEGGSQYVVTVKYKEPEPYYDLDISELQNAVRTYIADEVLELGPHEELVLTKFNTIKLDDRYLGKIKYG